MLSNKTNRTNEIYSTALTLETLREIMGLTKDSKFLIAITCRPEFYDYLLKLPELKTETEFHNIFGPEILIISNQKENIKYWYSDQKEDLKEYLKNNI